MVKWTQESWQLNNSATTEAQIQGFELTDPNIYPSINCWEYMKGSVLENQSYKIFITQGNNRTKERRPSVFNTVLLLQPLLQDQP